MSIPPQPSYENSLLRPVSLTPKQQELCKRLNALYGQYTEFEASASEMFQGALVARQRSYGNPDWVSQAANSLREIIYPLWSYQSKAVPDKRIDALRKYGSIRTDGVEEKIRGVYRALNDLTHHSPKRDPNEIEKLFPEFETVMLDALTRQTDLHRDIDKFVSIRPNDEKKTELEKLLVNADAVQYFYSKADENWLDWLWENGFLDIIKSGEKDEADDTYPPEFSYLMRMAKTVPRKVVDIMLATPMSLENFKLEVVDCFLSICYRLPANELAPVVEKIHKEGWLPLVSAFDKWAYIVGALFEKLENANDYGSQLLLAETMLLTRPEKQIKGNKLIDSPFYGDLSKTPIFKCLAGVGSDYLVQALELTSTVMAKVVALKSKEYKREGEKVFDVDDQCMLVDADFFELKLSMDYDRAPSATDIHDLAATVIKLADRLIGIYYGDPSKAKQIYGQYIEKLPDSSAIWRIRLYILTLYPDIFRDELKSALFRLFEVKRYFDITGGTEYMKALQKGFSVLLDKDKREYIGKLMDYFTERDRKKKDKHILKLGSDILSMIVDQLTPEEKERAKQEGFEFDPNYEPQPIIGVSETRGVTPQGPMEEDEFGELPVPEIIAKLQQEWTPDELVAQDKGGDIFNPLNAEGLGRMLSDDIPKRLQEYVDNATKFLNLKLKLDLHYTYSFLRGIEEAIKRDLEGPAKIDWEQLINLCLAISKLGFENPPARTNVEYTRFGGGLLIGWNGVLSAMIDTLKMLLTENNGTTIIDFGKYRSRILTILNYPLSYPDPTPADERIETAQSTIQRAAGEGYFVTDPFTIAINSVRGRAFEALSRFVYQDGKRIQGETKIASDTKELYEDVLKAENNRALMFMFGQHLPIFYSRDRDWIRDLLPQIFPEEPDRKHLYTAAWEGYLSNNLYKTIFFDPAMQKLYKHGVELTKSDFPQEQEHFKDPDEGIADHLAIAYVYFEEFGLTDPLFKKFWYKGNPKQHASFVNFIGRTIVVRNDDGHLKKEPEIKDRLRKFWVWVLKEYKHKDPKPLVEFGTWVDLKKGLYDPGWLAKRIKETLEKTGGEMDLRYMDNVKYALIRLAKEEPKDTLEIIRLYLLVGNINDTNYPNIFPWYLKDHGWYEVLEILYENTETSSGVKTLINRLVLEGRSRFWELKKILGDET